VKAVDGLHGNAHGCIEPEGVVGGIKIVVDGLGDANDLEPTLAEALRDGLRAVAADEDDSIDALRLEASDHLAGNVFLSEFTAGDTEGIAPIGGP
jgi:hypothetical protein